MAKCNFGLSAYRNNRMDMVHNYVFRIYALNNLALSFDYLEFLFIL